MGKKVLGAVVTVGLLIATGGAGIAGFSFLGVAGFAGAALAVGVVTASSFILEALGPKPFGARLSVGSRDYRQTVKQSVVPARWVYGRARLGGVLCFVVDYLATEGGDTTSNTIQNPKGPQPIDASGNIITGRPTDDTDIIRRYNPKTGEDLGFYCREVGPIRLPKGQSLYAERWVSCPPDRIDNNNLPEYTPPDSTQGPDQPGPVGTETPEDSDIFPVQPNVINTYNPRNKQLTSRRCREWGATTDVKGRQTYGWRWVLCPPVQQDQHASQFYQAGDGDDDDPSHAISNLAQLKGTEGLFAVFALSEGAIDSILEIYVDGELMPFTESNGIIIPTSDNAGNVKFRHEQKDTLRFFVHKGEASGSALNKRWGRDGVLNGISAIGVEMAQYDQKPWPRLPSLEFVIKGITMTWPGQTTPVWTENAAAIRYHYLTEAKQFPVNYIDTDSVKSAFNVCSQKYDGISQYTINGVVSDDEDYDSVIKHMDFAWAGSAPEINGKIVFRPGAPGALKKTFTRDDLLSGDDPAWQVETPIYQYADALDCVMQSRVELDYLPFSMPRHGSQALDAIVDDLGTIAYVGYYSALLRLLQYHLKHRQAHRRARIRLVGGDQLTNYGITATDRVAFNMPVEGLNNQRFYVERVEYRYDGTIQMDVAEEPANLFTHDAILQRPYVRDVPIYSLLNEPTGLIANPSRNQANKVLWDISVISNESPNGENLHLRYRYGSGDSWKYGGSGGTLTGLAGGGIQIGARLVTQSYVSDWTRDSRLLFIQLDAPDGPQLQVAGQFKYQAGEVVSLSILVVLATAATTFTFTQTGKPAWMNLARALDPNSRTNRINITGTVPVNADETVNVTVEDSHGKSVTISFRVQAVTPALALTGVGSQQINQGVSTTLGTISADGVAPYQYTIDPAVPGITISNSGEVTALLSSLGDQEVVITVRDNTGRTGTVTITLTVVAALNGFGIGETSPVGIYSVTPALDHIGVVVLGLATDLFIFLNSNYLASSRRLSHSFTTITRLTNPADITGILGYSPAGLRKITFNASDVPSSAGYSIASGTTVDHWKYLSSKANKLYSLAQGRTANRRTFTEQYNCRDVTTYRTEEYNCRDVTTYRTEQYNCRDVTRTEQYNCRFVDVTTSKGPPRYVRVCDTRQVTDRVCDTRRVPTTRRVCDTRRVPTTRRVCDTRRRRVTYSYSHKLYLYVGTLGANGMTGYSAHLLKTIIQASSTSPFTLMATAVSGNYVYLYMIMEGVQGIWRCGLDGKGLTKRADRSDTDVLDMTADDSYLYILSGGNADRVNRIAIP